MQNFRHADGTLTSLPTLCIDTGMGLERMARVLQSKQNTFQIDQFQHLVTGIRNLLKTENLPVSPTCLEKSRSDKNPDPIQHSSQSQKIQVFTRKSLPIIYDPCHS